jgi:Ca2+-binding RTX toxin-like protein
MTRYVKFIGTRFAETLGVAAGTLSQNLLGKGGSDTLLGGLANDKIKGNDGNDWIDGGGGNDDIDGGKGLDTAVYQGRFSEYELTFKSNLDG